MLVNFLLISLSLTYCNKQNFQVITEPAGAIIYDRSKRQNVGISPLRTNLPDGKYSISVAKENFAEELLNFEISNSANSLKQPIVITLKTYLEKRRLQEYWHNRVFFETDTQLPSVKNSFIFKPAGKLFQISLKTGHLLGSPEKWQIQNDNLVITRPFGKALSFPLHNNKNDIFKAQRNLGYGVIFYTTISMK